MRIPRRAVLLVLLAIAGCTKPPETLVEVAAETEVAQAETAQAAVPAIIAIREVVESVAPIESATATRCVVHPEAVDLIVRFEVTSPQYYELKLQGVIWAGLHSGATWGVGFDGGHQTKAFIERAWEKHPQVDRLAITSGVIGLAAKNLVPQLRDVRTPYPMAADVFTLATLPVYCELAKRVFRNGWELLPERAQGALVATVYNRGASTQGARRLEMAILQTDCVPRGDVACIAVQLRSMPRLWVGTNVYDGLRKRYEATAKLAEKT